MATPYDIYAKVPVLHEHSYQAWSSAIKMVLIERGLEEAVLGPEQAIVEDEKLQKELEEKKKKGLACIFLSLPIRYRNLVESAKDGREAWLKLKKHFEPDSLAHLMHLKFLFWNAQFQGDISGYAADLSRLMEKLQEAGQPVSELDKVFQLLRYLPEEYENIVQTIYRREQKELIFAKVLDDVLAEQARLSQRREDKNYHIATTTSGLYRKESKVKVRASRPTNRKCFSCNSENHLRNQCPKLLLQRTRTPTKRDFSKTRTIKKNFSGQSSLLSVACSAETNMSTWILDTASSDHVCGQKELFSWITPITNKKLSSCIKNADTPVCGIGEVKLWYYNNHEFTFSNVLYVPSVTKNLISGVCLDKKGVKFVGGNGKIEVSRDKPLFTAYEQNGLYVVEFSSHPPVKEELNVYECNITESEKFKKLPKKKVNVKNKLESSKIGSQKNLHMWHRRCAHINSEYIKNTSRLEAVRGLPKFIGTTTPCEFCYEAKTRRVSFKPNLETKSKAPLELLHVDLCGPMPKHSIEGHSYFLSIVDDFSRKVWVYPLRSKHDTFRTFLTFLNNAERFTGRKVKSVRSDNGTEFVNSQFSQLFERLGITHERTNPYSPEMNSIVERFHYTAINGVNVLLRESGLGQGFWAEALRHFSYTWNRIVHTGTKTPCELYSGSKPSVHYLKPFGVKVYIGVPKQLRSKFDMRAKPGILTGYALHTRGYRVWIPSEHKFVETINLKIVESENGQDTPENEDFLVDTLLPQESVIALRENFVETPFPTVSKEITSPDEVTPITTETVELQSSEESETDSSPPNWRRKLVPRKDGTRTDVYYYYGDSKRLRSLKDVELYCIFEKLPFDKKFFNFSPSYKYEGEIATDQPAGTSMQS